MGTTTHPTSVAGTSGTTQRRGHEYHAEAHLLSGALERPIVQEIPKQAAVSLRDWRGGHIYQRAHGYDLEGLISFKSGYTRVSGYRSVKKGHAFVTMATSVIEGLNVFDVLTCDRVVAQVSTEHEPTNGNLGHVPRVHFLGTQFVNLKLSGYAVNVTLNPAICGDRPKGDVPYLYDRGFLGRVEQQAEDISKFSDIPDELKERADEFREGYRKELGEIKCLVDSAKASKGGFTDDFEPRQLVCSLVSDITFPNAIPGASTKGNAVYLRDFGILSLGSLEVGRKREEDPDGTISMSNYFTIRMFDMHLGCVGDGKVTAASGTGNGKGKP